jgi:hypothetical protein
MIKKIEVLFGSVLGAGTATQLPVVAVAGNSKTSFVW